MITLKSYLGSSGASARGYAIMKLKVREISQEESDVFDSFAAKSEFAHSMQMSNWSHVIEAEKNTRAKLIVFENNASIVATAVLHFKPLFNIFRGIICEGGPIVHDHASRDVWDAVIRSLTSYAKKKGAILIRAWPYVHYEGKEWLIELFRSHGYSPYGTGKNFRGTNFISLDKSPDEILQTMHSSARRDVRLCLRKGVEIRHFTDNQHLEEFWEVFSETCRTKGIKVPWHFDSLAMMLKLGIASIHMVIYEGVTLHTIFLIHHPNKASIMLLFAGTTRNANGIPAGHLLHWEAIKWAQEHGFAMYDLGGIGFDDSSEAIKRIDDFKRRLGGYDVKILNSYERIFYFASSANKIRDIANKMMCHGFPIRNALKNSTAGKGG
jgi:serine/alanine adding enzyme